MTLTANELSFRTACIFFLMYSTTWADRNRVDFSIDASLQLDVPSATTVPQINATWDFEVYYDSDSRHYDLFTKLRGEGVHAASVHERAGLGVDDAGRLTGHVTDPLLPDVDLSLTVHPNDFRIDRGPDDGFFRLRPEHDQATALARGTAGPYSATFSYEPDGLAFPTLIPDGDADGNGVVDFQDFLTLAVNFDRHDSSLTYKDGDFNYDNEVDFDDFAILADNFGAGAAQVTAVPEPTGAVLLLIALATMLPIRRHR